MNLPADSKFAIAIVGANGYRYKPDTQAESFTPEAVKAVAESFLAGQIPRHVKSEEPPKDSGPVTVVTGRTFDELVTNSDKDVFIEFYAPWCGHCKQLAPTWDKLAEKFASVDSVRIAKMDATANDVPSSFEVHGFPTIYLLKANNKGSPVQYNGGRDLPALSKWLKENASKKIHDEL